MSRRLAAASVVSLSVFAGAAGSATATPAGQNGPIVMLRYLSGSSFTRDAIFTVDPTDTSGANGLGATSATQLPSQVSGGQYVIQPAVSPDGKRIAYAAADPDSGGSLRIWVRNFDGTDAHALPDTGSGDDRSPAWSPDGKQIVFSNTPTGGSAQKLWLMGDNGSSPVQITSGDGSDTGAEISPDGTRIAWAHTPTTTNASQVFVRSLDSGGAAVQITDSVCLNDGPTWSPDGLKIAFRSEDNEQGNSGCAGEHIDVIDLTKQLPQKLTAANDLTHTGEENKDPVWSPDGKQIAWTGERPDPSTGTGFRWGVWIMDADGGNPRLVSNYRFSLYGDEYPSWVTLPAAPTEATTPITNTTPTNTTTTTAGGAGGAAGTSGGGSAGGGAANGGAGQAGAGAAGVTPTTPGLTVAVQKVKAKSGAVSVPITAPGAGIATISGPGLKSVKGKVGAAGAAAFKLKLTTAEAKTLKKKHKVTIKVTVVFTPASGKPTTTTSSLTITT